MEKSDYLLRIFAYRTIISWNLLLDGLSLDQLLLGGAVGVDHDVEAGLRIIVT